MMVGAIDESLKTIFDGLGETMLHTQSSALSTQSPTHSTTSQEQKVTKTIGSTQKDKKEDIFHVFSDIKKKNEELKLKT